MIQTRLCLLEPKCARKCQAAGWHQPFLRLHWPETEHTGWDTFFLGDLLSISIGLPTSLQKLIPDYLLLPNAAELSTVACKAPLNHSPSV
jgi:hypothetical protein